MLEMCFKTIVTATTEKTKRPVQKDNVSDIHVLLFQQRRSVPKTQRETVNNICHVLDFMGRGMKIFHSLCSRKKLLLIL
jgi:hypothetical protein